MMIHIQKFNRELFIIGIIAGKCETKEEYEHLKDVNEVPPRFGFNWWFWVPKVEVMPRNSTTIFQIFWGPGCFELAGR